MIIKFFFDKIEYYVSIFSKQYFIYDNKFF